METSRLIRDRANISTPRDELISYINMARNDVCLLTACLRALVAGNAPFGSGSTPGLMVPGGFTPGIPDTTVTTFATLPGVEHYHFGYARLYLQAQWAGYDNVVDLMSVAVSWGSAARPVMEWMDFAELQALARIYSAGVFTYPFKAALQGDGINQILYLFPVPGQALEMEWDCSCTPKPLYNNNDLEAIPAPFRDAIKFKAANYVYMASQRFGSAELMEGEYLRHLGIDRAATDRGKVPSFYV
ncbi:MAG TPA: hypothetical protein VN663_22865 [Ramlibacter sp.]|nr:hypothetical protein [Ramlibacter sp.]